MPLSLQVGLVKFVLAEHEIFLIAKKTVVFLLKITSMLH